MTERTYWGNQATITITDTKGSPTTTTLAVIQGFTAKFKAEHKKLRGQDSIDTVEVRRYNAETTGTIKYAKFDPTVSTDWLGMVLAGSSAAAPTGATADVSTVALFTITGMVTDGTQKHMISIPNCYFEEVPFVTPENDYVVRDLTFTGRLPTLSNPA